MLHFNWAINFGEVVTWAVALGGLCYWSGRLRQKVENIGTEIDELRDDFREHCDQDVTRFENLNSGLRLLQSKAANPSSKKG